MKTNGPSKANASRSSAAIIYLSVGAAAVGVVATGAYLLSDRANTPITASLQSSVQAPIPARESSALNTDHSKQIELAMSAYNAGKLVTPAGENALEYYLAALQSKPNDFGAQEAIMELVPVAMTALESAMAANVAKEVERLLAVLERADPSAARVAALKQRWQASVAQASVAQQASAVAAAPRLENVQAPATFTVPEIGRPEIAAAQVAIQATTPAPTIAPTIAPTDVSTAVAVTTETQNTLAAQASPAQASPKAATAPVQDRVVEARALSTARAVFPAQARRQKIEGWVDLQVVVDASGRVTEALVLGAQPSRIFDVEARRAVLRWRYSPKRVNDQPVSSVLRQRIKFSLTS